MDQRQTFASEAELVAILQDLYSAGIAASLLLSREGLTRMEGVVASINDHSFTLTGGDSSIILFTEVIAVNGIFHADYTEC